MNHPLRIGILGPGAVGGLLAAVFWKHGCSVTCIAKPEAVERIKTQGITLRSQTFGEIIAKPNASPRLEKDVDILFIAVKANELKDALTRIPPTSISQAVIVPLLNGIEHISLIRQQLGDNVIAATIGSVEVFRDAEGNIVHANGTGEISIGSDDPEQAAHLQRVSDVLTQLPITCTVKSSEKAVLWGKLTRLCPIAAATAAFQCPLGEIRNEPMQNSLLEESVTECVRVAQADGADIKKDAVQRIIASLPSGLVTSLARDVAQARAGEQDAIIGAVIRAGRRHGIPCPSLERLSNIITRRLTQAA